MVLSVFWCRNLHRWVSIIAKDHKKLKLMGVGISMLNAGQILDGTVVGNECILLLLIKRLSASPSFYGCRTNYRPKHWVRAPAS